MTGVQTCALPISVDQSFGLLQILVGDLGQDLHVHVGVTGDNTHGGGDKAATAAKVKDADVIVYVGGISPRLEGEEMPVNVEGFKKGDRTNIEIPKVQQEMVKALKATGKPVVYVLCTGSALALNWEDANIDAILNAWYGGQEAGTAVADILFGDYNPSGRLPVTFYKSIDQLPDFEDYSMKGRTYRYMTETRSEERRVGKECRSRWSPDH